MSITLGGFASLMAPRPPEQRNENASMHLHEVLAMEFRELHGEPPRESADAVPLRSDLGIAEAHRLQEQKQQEHLKNIWAAVHQLGEKRAALCISGGGIRSVAFTLGVLQGLARSGLLGKFHYLSTVSGGGFIGGWLMAWILRAKGGFGEVSGNLAKGRPDTRPNPEPYELQNLRSYSSYLSPRLGLLSADTWTFLATYFRNLFLNWLVLIPLLAAVLTIPWIYLAVLMQTPPPYTLAPFWLGITCLVVGVAYMGLNLPSGSNVRWNEKRFLWLCLYPLFLGAVLVTIHWAWFTNYGGQTPTWPFLPGMKSHTLSPFLWLGVAVHVIAWAFSLLRSHGFRLLEFLAVIAAGAIGGTLLWVGAIKLFPQPLLVWKLYCCFAIPLLAGLFLVALNLFAGLSSRWTGDADREWWSRAGGWFLVTSVVWILISLLLYFGTYFGTLLLSWVVSSTLSKLTVGSIAGALTLIVGRSSLFLANLKNRDRTSPLTRILSEVAAIAALLFMAALLMNLTISIVKRLGPAVYPSWNLDFPEKDAYLNVLLYTPWWHVTAVALVLAFIGIAMAYVINPNLFSLHAMYRDRLIRAYLGASNRNRNPNPFSGFDENDNLRMRDLWQGEKIGGKLFPVINVALNLVHGSKLAWQERKAASFTVSPLHCGSHLLGYRRTGASQDWRYGSEDEVSTDASPPPTSPKFYGGEEGISLGTAMTISGAVPRSNKSSPLVMFILTILNFRMGVWLGNPGPAGNKTFQLGFPNFSVRSIIAEAFGLNDDSNPYVYLSDGRHFDALGLYEMVMRRCHYIVVCDAGADPDFTFGSLAEAIRRTRMDLGIEIVFDEPMLIFARSDDQAANRKGRSFAIGRICYSGADGPGTADGVLIYIKPACYGEEPRDIYEYVKSNASFPHESAGDQFFSESRFESYRMLGAYTMQKIRGKQPGESDTIADFESFVARIVEYRQTSDSDGPAADLKSFISKLRKYIEESD